MYRTCFINKHNIHVYIHKFFEFLFTTTLFPLQFLSSFLFFFVFYAADDSVSALNFLELATSTVEIIIKLNRCNVKHKVRFDR